MLEFRVQGFRVVLGSFKWGDRGYGGFTGFRFLRGVAEYKASEGSHKLYGKL